MLLSRRSKYANREKSDKYEGIDNKLHRASAKSKRFDFKDSSGKNDKLFPFKNK